MTIAAYGQFTARGIAKLAAQRAKQIETECRAVQTEPAPVAVPVAEREVAKIVPIRPIPEPKEFAVMQRRGMPLWARRIVVAVAEKHGVGIADIIGTSRVRAIVAARNEAYYLIRTGIQTSTGKHPSYPQIGDWFGREHTGVLYGTSKHAAENSLPLASSFDAEEKMARKRVTSLAWARKLRSEA